MPVFIYKAKQDNAQTVSGEVTARDPQEAVDLVSQLGLLPVSVEEKGAAASVVLRTRRVKPRAVHAFTRQLVSLLKSGVPLLRALEVLQHQMRDVPFSSITQDVIVNLRNGRTFSSCLQDHPRAFPDIYVALVRAGEESGRLKELLASLTVYHRKQDEISQKIRGALTYPAFMLVVGLATVIFILSFVMPRISVLFEGLQTELPWPTKLIMGLSHAVHVAWPALVVAVFLGAVVYRFVAQAPVLRRRIRSFFMGLPLIRDLAVKTDMERFSRTLGLLLESGIPILKALEIAVPTLEHEPLRAELALSKERVAGGASLGECLRESANIPDIVAQLIVVGEESGELPGSLRDIADTYEQEIGEATKAATTLLEPLLILIVGLVVGFIVFAMLMPVFQMDMFAA
jgi:type II secretory pathway component PulF